MNTLKKRPIPNGSKCKQAIKQKHVCKTLEGRELYSPEQLTRLLDENIGCKKRDEASPPTLIYELIERRMA